MVHARTKAGHRYCLSEVSGVTFNKNFKAATVRKVW